MRQLSQENVILNSEDVYKSINFRKKYLHPVSKSSSSPQHAFYTPHHIEKSTGQAKNNHRTEIVLSISNLLPHWLQFHLVEIPLS